MVVVVVEVVEVVVEVVVVWRISHATGGGAMMVAGDLLLSFS